MAAALSKGTHHLDSLWSPYYGLLLKIAFLASLVLLMAVMANLLYFFIVRPNLVLFEMNKQAMWIYVGICVCVHFLVAKLMSRFMGIFIWPFGFHCFGATRAWTSVFFNLLKDVPAEAYFDLQPAVATNKLQHAAIEKNYPFIHWLIRFTQSNENTVFAVHNSSPSFVPMLFHSQKQANIGFNLCKPVT